MGIHELYLLPVPEDARLRSREASAWLSEKLPAYARVVAQALLLDDHEVRVETYWLAHDLAEMAEAAQAVTEGRHAELRRIHEEHAAAPAKILLGLYQRAIAEDEELPPEVLPALDELRALAERHLDEARVSDRRQLFTRLHYHLEDALDVAAAEDLADLDRDLRAALPRAQEPGGAGRLIGRLRAALAESGVDAEGEGE